MNCPKCGQEMEDGFLYSSKDGALSFSYDVPGVFESATKADGFVPVSEFVAARRTRVKAHNCKECKIILIEY